MRLLALLAPLFGLLVLSGCHDDEDHDRHRHSRFDRDYERRDVIVVPARGPDWNSRYDRDYWHRHD
jgi:hypothetical protein